MNKILLMVFTGMAAFANASEPEYDKTNEAEYDKTNEAAIIAKFEIDTHAIKDYSVLGKAQCFSEVFSTREIFNGTKVLYDSELYVYAYNRLYYAQSPLIRLLSPIAIKNSLKSFIETSNAKNRTTVKVATGESYAFNATTDCEKMFDGKNDALRKAYLTLIQNSDSYVKPNDANKYTPKEVKQLQTDYLKYDVIRLYIRKCQAGSPANFC
ncbi:hypothetical protein D7V20_19250 [Acinetobacter rongchengensis]|uniref:Uncharacterized protein n=2 Tax=Acinetobacter rongchengensis TaxID=2419601 RepID=A0A3A8E6T7_9GAMM|nr:hypothetical protein D7V20_19250 [Acinetobacter rongchengensis]